MWCGSAQPQAVRQQSLPEPSRPQNSPLQVKLYASVPPSLLLDEEMKLRLKLRGPYNQAAAFLFIARRASTMATVSSTTGLCIPCCAAMLCTRRSTRSMLGAPANKARAADDGRTSTCAAAAYFSNGTKSSRDAPNLTQSSTTQL